MGSVYSLVHSKLDSTSTHILGYIISQYKRKSARNKGGTIWDNAGFADTRQ